MMDGTSEAKQNIEILVFKKSFQAKSFLLSKSIKRHLDFFFSSSSWTIFQFYFLFFSNVFFKIGWNSRLYIFGQFISFWKHFGSFLNYHNLLMTNCMCWLLNYIKHVTYKSEAFNSEPVQKNRRHIVYWVQKYPRDYHFHVIFRENTKDFHFFFLKSKISFFWKTCYNSLTQ